MASSPGVEFVDNTMELFAELETMAALNLEDDDDVKAVPAPNAKQQETPAKIENKKTDGTKDLLIAPSTEVGRGDRDSDTTAHAASDAEKPEPGDVKNVPAAVEDNDYAADSESEPASDAEEHTGPHILINMTDDSEHSMKLVVIVSMVSPFADCTNTLIHAGDFMMEVTPLTTIREIKNGITEALEICYEDMALVFVGKFLSDARTIEYYFIEDGQTLHLLVESPNTLFKDVFEAFKKLELNEEKAWFATRGFIHLMHGKYSNGFSNDETPSLTEEQLLIELEQLYVPDSDESDDSSADEDEPEIEVHNANVVFLGGIELEFIADDSEEEEDDDDEDEEEDNSEDDENSQDDEENSDDDDQSSDDEDDDEEDDDDEEENENEEYLTPHAIAHLAPVELFEWN